MKHKLFCSSIKSFEDSISYRIYRKEIARIKLLSPEDEVKMFIALEKAETEAQRNTIRNKIILHNQAFVISVASAYKAKTKKIDLSDLISEGNMGMVEAINKFDHRRGFKFISFAVWWIEKFIRKYISNFNLTVKMGYHNIKSIYDFIETYSNTYMTYPTPSEISEELNIPKNITEIVLYNINPKRHVIPDEYVFDDDCKTYTDTDAGIDRRILREHIDHALRFLNERDRQIIYMYHGIDYDRPMGIYEIAFTFDLTHERVRQIIKAFRKRIRENKHYKQSLFKFY